MNLLEKNFEEFQSKVEKIQNQLIKGEVSDWLLVNTGHEKTGKTFTALTILTLFSKEEPIQNHIALTIEEFYQLIKKNRHKEGHVIIFDDIFDVVSRSEKKRKLLSELIATSKNYHLFNILNVSNFFDLDEYIRRRTKTLIVNLRINQLSDYQLSELTRSVAYNVEGMSIRDLEGISFIKAFYDTPILEYVASSQYKGFINTPKIFTIVKPTLFFTIPSYQSLEDNMKVFESYLNFWEKTKKLGFLEEKLMVEHIRTDFVGFVKSLEEEQQRELIKIFRTIREINNTYIGGRLFSTQGVYQIIKKNELTIQAFKRWIELFEKAGVLKWVRDNMAIKILDPTYYEVESLLEELFWKIEGAHIKLEAKIRALRDL